MRKFAILISTLAILCVAGAGCSGSESTVTKAEEDAFRNPPKEIPPESLKAMQKAREEGMRRAAEMRSKNGG
jgi:hypothetical protein